MTRVEKAIEIERPADRVYPVIAAWRWRSEDGGGTEAAPTEDVPGEAVTWHGVDSEGDVWRASLIALSPRRTRLDLVVDHDPHGLRERAAEVFGALERRVEEDLATLKAHVEESSPAPS